MRRFIGFDCHGLYLGASPIADLESGGDFTFLSGRHFLPLRLRNGATAGGADRFETNRGASSVLILEMANCFLVPNDGMQLERRLLPFQFRMRCRGENDEQDCSKDQRNGFHSDYFTENFAFFLSKFCLSVARQKGGSSSP